MKNFKKLDIWQQGITIVGSTYKISKKLPKEEKYALGNQITRAAVSIPSNIAEGSAKDSDKDYKRFLGISLGSLFELETQLIVIKKLEYLEAREIDDLLNLVIKEQKMVSSFIKRL